MWLEIHGAWIRIGVEGRPGLGLGGQGRGRHQQAGERTTDHGVVLTEGITGSRRRDTVAPP